MSGIESFGRLQPQPLNLQPTQQLPFAEPQARTLDIKFSRPLDLQTAPQNLSEAIQQSNQLNPVGLAGARPIVKGLALAGVLAENYRDLQSDLTGFTPLEENGQVLADSIAAGNALESPGIDPLQGGDFTANGGVRVAFTNPFGVEQVLDYKSYEISEWSTWASPGWPLPAARYKYVIGPACSGINYVLNSDIAIAYQESPNFGATITQNIDRTSTLRILSSSACTTGEPVNLNSPIPNRAPNPARQGNRAPFKAPLPQPGFTPGLEDQPIGQSEPQIDPTSDLTPDELADMLVPRIDPLTGEIDKDKPKVPYWELPEDEWLISPPIVIDLRSGSNSDPNSPYQKFPPVIYLGGDNFTPVINRVIDPPEIIYPTKPNDCCSNTPTGDSCDLSPVIELLTTAVESELSLTPCGDGDAIELNSTGVGIDGLSQKIDVLAGALIQIWDKVKCSEDNDPPLIPEWWPVRKGANRPQLIVVYGVKEKDGTFNRATRYSFSIPWFEGKNRQSLSQLLPKNIKKGRYQATLTLSDNSKIIHFCRNKNESIRVVKEFEKLVIPKYRTGDIKTSDNQGSKREFKEVTVNPIMAKFYPTGQLDIKPVWVERFY